MLQSQNKTPTRLRLSIKEVGIFDDIHEIGFGELYDLEAGIEPGEIWKPLTPRQKSFIFTLRRELRFDKVMIHDGSPQYAVVYGKTMNGRSCQTKFKF